MNREEIEKLAARLETCDVRFQFKQISSDKRVMGVIEIPWVEAIPMILSKFPLWSLADIFDEKRDKNPMLFLHRDP